MQEQLFDTVVSEKGSSPILSRGLVTLAVIVFLVTLGVLAVGSYLVPGQISLEFVLLASACIAVLTAVMGHFLVLLPHTGPASGSEGTAGTSLSDWPITDSTTHTLNSRGITISLLELMALAERYGRKLSVAMVGVDQLGKVNQELGIPAGDTVLQTVAGSLNDALRMPDRVGRYSNDEFIILLPETDLQAAEQIAERIRLQVASEEITVAADQSVSSTISVGVTEFQSGEDLHQLITRSTRAMKSAKDQGRNRVVVEQTA